MRRVGWFRKRPPLAAASPVGIRSGEDRDLAESRRSAGLTRGEKPPTINDVARLASVSKKTVSRVINNSPLLNEDTRGRVEKVINQLGYVPNPQARALALRRNSLVGLIHDNPDAQTVINVQQGILDALHDTDFGLVVRRVDRTSPRMLDDLRNFLERQRLFGVVIMPPLSENDALARLCDDLGVRYTRMGSAELDDPDHLVASNDREAVGEAVAYLIEQGHQRIGLIEGPHGFRSAAERRLGFEDALRAAKIKLPRSLVAEGSYAASPSRGAWSRTAIFASNDEMAAGMLHAALQRGLQVPQDLSIVGFDDTAIAAHIWPPLTTIRWPTISMGRSAALKIVGDIIDPDSHGDEPSMFISTLVRRSSVAPPKA